MGEEGGGVERGTEGVAEYYRVGRRLWPVWEVMDAAVPRLGRSCRSIHNEGVAPYFFGGFPWIRVSRSLSACRSNHARSRPHNTPSSRRGISTRCGDLTVRNRGTARRNRTSFEKREERERRKKSASAADCLDIRAAPDPAITRIQEATCGRKSSGFVPGRRYRAETGPAGRTSTRQDASETGGHDDDTNAPGQDSGDYAIITSERRRPRSPDALTAGSLHTTPTTAIPGRPGRRPRVAESLSLETTTERVNTDGREPGRIGRRTTAAIGTSQSVQSSRRTRSSAYSIIRVPDKALDSTPDSDSPSADGPRIRPATHLPINGLVGRSRPSSPGRDCQGEKRGIACVRRRHQTASSRSDVIVRLGTARKKEGHGARGAVQSQREIFANWPTPTPIAISIAISTAISDRGFVERGRREKSRTIPPSHSDPCPTRKPSRDQGPSSEPSKDNPPRLGAETLARGADFQEPIGRDRAPVISPATGEEIACFTRGAIRPTGFLPRAGISRRTRKEGSRPLRQEERKAGAPREIPGRKPTGKSRPPKSRPTGVRAAAGHVPRE